MNFLKIRQVQIALKGGRLEEACKLLQEPGVRSHREGQRLVDKVVNRLLARAEEHLAVSQGKEAMADVVMAERMGTVTPESSRLRKNAATLVEQTIRAKEQADRIAHAARRQVEVGQLSIAEAMLAGLDDNANAGLREEVARQRQITAAMTERVRNAMDDEDFERAMVLLEKAAARGRVGHALETLTGEVVAKGTDAACQALAEGRLDRAARLLDRLLKLAPEKLAVQELSGLMAVCEQAAEAMEDRKLREAVEGLTRLTRLVKGAGWAEEALADAEEALRRLERLRRGALGQIKEVPAKRQSSSEPPADGAAARLPEDRRRAVSPGTDEPKVFSLMVDGVGSCVVARGRRVMIGPISGSEPVDVRLAVDPGLGAIRVERVEEDYFVESTRGVKVDGHVTQRALLRDGARVELSPRCVLRFRKPHAASTSAVLDLGGTRLAGNDARCVVLMDQELLVGPSGRAHLAGMTAGRTVALRWQEGGLAGRDQGGEGVWRTLPWGQPVDVEGMRMVVQRMDEAWM